MVKENIEEMQTPFPSLHTLKIKKKAEFKHPAHISIELAKQGFPVNKDRLLFDKYYLKLEKAKYYSDVLTIFNNLFEDGRLLGYTKGIDDACSFIKSNVSTSIHDWLIPALIELKKEE